MPLCGATLLGGVGGGALAMQVSESTLQVCLETFLKYPEAPFSTVTMPHNASQCAGVP